MKQQLEGHALMAVFLTGQGLLLPRRELRMETPAEFDGHPIPWVVKQSHD